MTAQHNAHLIRSHSSVFERIIGSQMLFSTTGSNRNGEVSESTCYSSWAMVSMTDFSYTL